MNEDPSEYPLPDGLDGPTTQAVLVTLKTLASIANVRQMGAGEFVPYFVEAVGFGVAEMLSGLNIWLDDPFKPEEIQEMVGSVALRFLTEGRRPADLTGAEMAQMTTDAVDLYVGKELDKQAKAVITAHTLMQQNRGI